MSLLSLDDPGRRERLVVLLLLAVAGCAIYAPVLGHEFVNLDDVDGILEHPLFQEGLSPATLLAHFTEPYQHNWIPLNWVSLHLSHALHGREAAGYLATNVVLHVLASALLFTALLRMTRAFYCSAFTALFFLVHPLHVESVAWASERKDVLSAVFFMLVLHAHARFAESPSRGRAAAVAVFLLLGLLSKPMLVTAPFVLLLLDLWPLDRLRRAGDERLVDPALLRARIVEKWPLFVIVVAVSAVTWLVQASTGAVSSLEQVPFVHRVANALNAYLVYLSQTVLPQGLAVLYPLPAEPEWSAAAGAAALLVGATAIALASARERPFLLVGWLWFVGMLVPVIGLVQVGIQAHADRYMYLPQIGLGVALAWGAARAARDTPASRPAFAVVGVLVLGWFGGLAWQQVHFWKDTTTLYGRAISVTTGNYLAHKGLGDALLREGRLQEAQLHYQEANALRPGWMEAELGMADVLAAQGQVPAALGIYARWVEAAPDEPRPQGSLGLALLRVGRFDEALERIEAGLRADPRAAELHAGRGVALHAAGRTDEAVEAYRRALRLDPDLATAQNNLAWILAVSADPEVRDADEAIRLAEAARARTPDDPAVLDPLGAAYAASGRFKEAIATAERASELAREAGALALSQEMARRRGLYVRGKAYVETR
ncbi:MAG: tetratricopeptide repeat protein [Myxococcota bacterium]